MSIYEDRRKLWAAALPAYEQGTGALRYKDSFCCLGVGCEVYRIATGNGEWKDIGDCASESAMNRDCDYFLLNGNYQGMALPVEVADWYGLDSCSPKDQATDTHLADLNDKGISFDIIGPIIANLKDS